MAEKVTYIEYSARAKSTTADGIFAEAQQILDVTLQKNQQDINADLYSVKADKSNTYTKEQVDNAISTKVGSLYRVKGTKTAAELKSLTSAVVGDVYNISDQVTIGGKTYPAGLNVVCTKAFTSAISDLATYWDPLAPHIDLSPYAKTDAVNTELEKKANSADVYTKTKTDELLGGKVNVEAGKGLSEANFTNAEKNKLSGIAANAQVNVLEGVQLDGTDYSISSKKVNIDSDELVSKVAYRKSETYTKGEVNSLVQDTQKLGTAELNSHANVAFDVYMEGAPGSINESSARPGFKIVYSAANDRFYATLGGQYYTNFKGEELYNDGLLPSSKSIKTKTYVLIGDKTLGVSPEVYGYNSATQKLAALKLKQVSDVEKKVDANATAISGHGTRLTAVEGKADTNTSTISSHGTRLNAVEGKANTNASDISTLKTTKAAAADLNALTKRVEALEALLKLA